MATNSTTALTTLAYLMGERTVQSSTSAPRLVFLQKTLEEVYRAYKWPFASAKVILTVTNGVATLPADFDYQHGINAFFMSGTQQVPVYDVNATDQTGYQTGSHRFWIEPLDDNTYTLNTKDTNYSDIYVQYQEKAPTLSASTYTAYDDDMALAIGARRYIKLSQDPNADISQDEALFQKRLTESIAATQVSNPKRRARFLSQANGHRTGAGYSEDGQYIRIAGS